MKLKKRPLADETPRGHKYRKGDVLHLGQDIIHIGQVDTSTSYCHYYGVSYTPKGAKRPICGWIFAAFLDNLYVTDTDYARTHKEVRLKHDDNKPKVRIIR